MFAEAALGEGWTVWNAESDRAVLAYRPDIFDGSSFPAPCLPTVHLSRGLQNRRPESAHDPPPDAPWVVVLRLEPSVERQPDTYDAKADAIDGVEQLTDSFSSGEIDYRALYQVPRDSYLATLDELIGCQ